jgi:spermidine synthase
MKPRLKLAATRTPSGSELVLYQHDRDFYIEVNGQDLMQSRQHESELELARLGCAHLAGRRGARVLVGGLGMGYTLRQTLDLLGPDAKVVVAELLPAVLEWNREYLGVLNNQPLNDPRVEVHSGDIVKLIAASKNQFDAILLDVDNGPRAMTDASNHRLYSYAGTVACHQALREQGCLAIWSAESSKDYEHLLVSCGFQVRRHRVPTHLGSKSDSRFVWVAATNPASLPPGGSEPRPPRKHVSKGSRGQSRGKR